MVFSSFPSKSSTLASTVASLIASLGTEAEPETATPGSPPSGSFLTEPVYLGSPFAFPPLLLPPLVPLLTMTTTMRTKTTMTTRMMNSIPLVEMLRPS
jgi:hypothetical protein